MEVLGRNGKIGLTVKTNKNNVSCSMHCEIQYEKRVVYLPIILILSHKMYTENIRLKCILVSVM